MIRVLLLTRLIIILAVKLRIFLCCDNNHLFDIDVYYNEIVLALTQAANFNIPKVPKNAIKHYWSITLDELNGITVCPDRRTRIILIYVHFTQF